MVGEFMLKRNLFIFLALFFLAQSVFAQSQLKPEAQPEAMVVDGDVRFTVLTPRLVRMEQVPGGDFEDRASLTFINRNLPVPSFAVEKSDQWLEIRTDALRLKYRRNSGAFDKDNLQIRFNLNGESIHWTPGMVNTGNLLGTTRTVDGFEGTLRLRDGTRLELEQGLLSRDGWSLVDDSDNLLFGDARHWVVPREVENNQDWYFFAYGHDYEQALRDFTRIAGKIPMPPRYAFGYWWSRYWSYSDAELRDLVKTIDDYDIPLDVLVVDMDWHQTYGLTSNHAKPTPFNGMLGWTGYTWNKSLFPNPEKFLQWTQAQDLKVALNLHPSDGIAPMEQGYDAMLDSLDGQTHDSGWIEYRLADEQWAGVYFEHMLRPKERIGVDFWWLDWQQWPESKLVPGLSNTFWLNHVFFTDMEKTHSERRPLIFHRWGGLGNHRYQVGFSGDAVISWKSLAFQPQFTATASNVGYGYWSHDIGGHIVKDEELAKNGELYLRWIQFGAMSPILRTHASKSDVAERRIWMYPELFPMMRDAIRLRYSLVPYIYTAARQAYDTGVSISRPMYYDWPEQEAAYHAGQQYMLGDSIIVAPVVSPVDEQSQLAAQKIWLPKGQWYEWSSGTLLKGNTSIKRNFSVEEIPLYVKAGTILPMYPEVDNLQEQPEQRVLTVIPGGSGETRYYEDAGDSQAYKTGAFAWTHVKSEQTNDGLRLTIAPAEGRYAGMNPNRSFVIRLPLSLPVESVRVNGRTLSAQALAYKGETLTQEITTGTFSVNEEVVVEIVRPQTVEQLALLNGKPGVFHRLGKMAERLKKLSAREDWAATIPNHVLKLVSTPSRINYEPEKIRDYLIEFETMLPTLEKAMEHMPQITDKEAENLAAFVHH